MGDENKYPAPTPVKRRTPWADRTHAARREDVEFIKTLRDPWLDFYCRGIGTTAEAIRAWGEKLAAEGKQQ